MLNLKDIRKDLNFFKEKIKSRFINNSDQILDLLIKLDYSKSVVIFCKKAILEYQRILVPFILDKMEKKDDKIDWENIKKTFLSLGITFDYLNDYDNDIVLEKINCS